MSSAISVSIIIPVYNGEETLAACLDSIFACRWAGYEVIVIDDASTDGTASILRRYACRVITLPENKGQGFARNRGIDASRAEILLFTDADCIVSPDWPRVAFEEFQQLKEADPAIVGAAGRILPLKGFFAKCDAFAAYGYNQNVQPVYTDHFCTANMIVDKEPVVSAGLFSESLRNFEDLDLGLRLLEQGRRLYYQPSVWIHHNHTRKGLWRFLGHEYAWGKNSGPSLKKRHPQYRRTPLDPWLGYSWVYALTIPLFSAFITLKIMARNWRYDPSIILVAPFIFMSKVAFRVGALQHRSAG